MQAFSCSFLKDFTVWTVENGWVVVLLCAFLVRSGHKILRMNNSNNKDCIHVEGGVPVTQPPNPSTQSHVITNRQRKCGQCGQIGHNKRSCTAATTHGKFFLVDCFPQHKPTQFLMFFHTNTPFYQCSCLRYLPREDYQRSDHGGKTTITHFKQHQ
jgi:hypothetical protein